MSTATPAALAPRLRPVSGCPVCGHPDASTWLRATEFTLVACNRCGHVYSNRVLASHALADEYYAEADADLAARSMAAKEDRLREYEALLAPHGISSGRVLDVGCNAGDLLTLFRRRGRSVAGIEPSAGPAEFARRERHIPVWTGTLDVLPEEEKFDLITMTHVLEHVDAPAAFLARARAALAPGGLVLVEVPNVRDPLVRIWGRHYRPLCLGITFPSFPPRRCAPSSRRRLFVFSRKPRRPMRATSSTRACSARSTPCARSGEAGRLRTARAARLSEWRRSSAIEARCAHPCGRASTL